MIYPKFIQEGNCIAIPAPSAGAGNELYQNKFNNSINYLEKLGYKLLLSNNIFSSIKGRSASAKDRANEINSMFSDDNINFILCACGGDFLIEILPYINFDLIKQNPKYIAGFSDPTGLLFPITTKYDIATIYGHNFGSFGTDTIFKDKQDFLKIIKGNIIDQKSFTLYEESPFEKVTGTEPPNFTEKVYWKTLDGHPINQKGRIIGGCFDIISELIGTKYDGISSFNEKYKDDGIIWYFDNCELSMEETIRVLWKMNEFNYFKYTKCIIFGRFGINNTCYDYDVKSCLEDSILGQLNIPIIFDADISHKSPCITIINGAITTVSVNNGKGKISFQLD